MATLTLQQITDIVNLGQSVYMDCGGVPKRIDEISEIPPDLTACGFTERNLSEYTIVGSPTNGQVPSYNNTTQKLEWSTPSSGGGAWGTITGTLSNQTDLQTALNLKANLASPALTGTPTTPTAAGGTNTTQIASTAFVRSEISALVNSAPSTLDTLNELAAALGNDPNFATTITNSLAGKANLTDNLSVFAATTSLQLKNLISDETGSESLVFRLAPTLKNIVVNQNQNNDDMILAIRATDSSPTGTFINYRNAAASQIFKVGIDGSTYSQGLFLNSSTGNIQWGDNSSFGTIRGFLGTAADGVFRFGDSAGGGSPHIILGSNSSSFVRIKRNGTALSVRLGDDSGDGDITSALNTITRLNLGTTSTDGLVLQNTTAAAAGAQQYSPSLRLTGQGWKTNATAASQQVDWTLENQPVQGATNPSTTFVLKSQVNGGGYTNHLAVKRVDGAAAGMLTFDQNLVMVNRTDVPANNYAAFGTAGTIAGFFLGGGYGLHWVGGSFVSTAPTSVLSLVRVSNGVGRFTDGSTGGSQWIFGTSTDTADAQLSVYSQSTTRPSLKLRALSGTAVGQEGLGSYDSSGAKTFSILAGGAIAWGSSADVLLDRDAANVLAQRNGTNAQTFRIYNTYTDASNYERLLLRWSASVAGIFTDQAGTGTNRSLQIGTLGVGSLFLATNGSTKWVIDQNGHLTANVDNTYDIGASGANRPKDINAAGVIRAGGSGYFVLTGKSAISSSFDGNILLQNNALTGFDRLQFGGTTSSFPALKRSSAILQARLADDSAFAEIDASIFLANSGSTGAALSGGGLGLTRDVPITWTNSNSTPLTGTQAQLYACSAAVNMFGLGGITSSFPALKRSAATLQVKLADDSAYASLTADNLYAAGVLIGFNGSTTIRNASDGVIRIVDSSDANFGRLQFGGTTSSYPSLKRSSAALHVRLADDSDYAVIVAKELDLDKTITTGGTTGAQTINKAAGTVNFAASATSLVVTNSLVSTSSIIMVTVGTDDTTMKSAHVVAAGGSFTIYPDVAPTAGTRVNFLVIN